MFRTALLVCGLLSISLSPARAAGVDKCKPESADPEALQKSIVCMQEIIRQLEARTSPGSSFKLGFNEGQCLSVPTGVGGATMGTTPPIEAGKPALLQDCKDAPALKLMGK